MDCLVLGYSSYVIITEFREKAQTTHTYHLMPADELGICHLEALFYASEP